VGSKMEHASAEAERQQRPGPRRRPRVPTASSRETQGQGGRAPRGEAGELRATAPGWEGGGVVWEGGRDDDWR
jgi:hypothetical protein